MRLNRLVAPGVLMAASPLAAQENPFAFTGGGVKTAYIVYEVISKEKQGQGYSFEIGVTPDRWIMRTSSPFDMGGKKDTVRILAVTTRDSQYTVTTTTAQRFAEASPLMRPHLAREYAALDAVAKGRFRQNLKLAVESGGSSDADMYMTLIGDKVGSETVVGHKCDVYKTKKATACVLPEAPGVLLHWADDKQGVNVVAKKVTLNGPMPPALGVLPKGVQWEQKSFDDADFVMNVWQFKKQTDPERVPPASVAQFAVRYLASAGAASELRAMQSDPSGGSGENPDDEAKSDESGS